MLKVMVLPADVACMAQMHRYFERSFTGRGLYGADGIFNPPECCAFDMR